MKATKKQRTKNILRKLFTGIFIIVSVCLMLSLADLFSNLITVGGFTFVSDEVFLSKYTMYAVCVSSHSTKILAQDNSDSCFSLGGAGYIWMNNEG